MSGTCFFFLSLRTTLPFFFHGFPGVLVQLRTDWLRQDSHDVRIWYRNDEGYRAEGGRAHPCEGGRPAGRSYRLLVVWVSQ